jgi:glycyl-tRNA synthetase
VRRGNETVVRARFEDAAFFWRADLDIEPRELRRRLTTLTFHEQLGSVSGRADRIASLARAFAAQAGLSSTDLENLAQASSLAKFDLASHLVVEFTSLAGIMAREYALKAGESEEVAQALYEMELPRHHADQLPVSTIGRILALADRFDLLVGMLAVGAKLTGTSDPYGLRRAALGIVRILRTAPELAALTIPFGLETAAEHLRTSGSTVDAGVLTVAKDLLNARFAQRLRDEQVPAALIAAVAPAATESPLRADHLRADIENSMTRYGQQFFDLVEALQRIIRILPSDAPHSYDVSILTAEAEVGLVTALEELTQLPDVPLVDWTSHSPGLVAALQRFFEDVLVMADQPDLREARLGLLASVLDAAPSGIDWQAVHLLRTDAE